MADAKPAPAAAPAAAVSDPPASAAPPPAPKPAADPPVAPPAEKPKDPPAEKPKDPPEEPAVMGAGVGDGGPAFPAMPAVITDFAGTPGGPFAVYGRNLDQPGQLFLNGQVPDITVRRADVIKGRLVAPGLDLRTGPVTVEFAGTRFEGVL